MPLCNQPGMIGLQWSMCSSHLNALCNTESGLHLNNLTQGFHIYSLFSHICEHENATNMGIAERFMDMTLLMFKIVIKYGLISLITIIFNCAKSQIFEMYYVKYSIHMFAQELYSTHY